jgi:hypothetical protein
MSERASSTSNAQQQQQQQQQQQHMVGPPRPGESSAQLEQRRAENEERLLADELEAERNAAHRRGEWMTQLPKVHKRGEGMPTQRAFSHTDVTVKQDAAWTAAPHNRADAMAASARERVAPTEPLNMEALAARERTPALAP